MSKSPVSVPQNTPVASTTAVLLLGSNLGDRRQYLVDAQTAITLQCGSVECTSAIYESAAWGVANQQDYLNQVVVVQTMLLPERLLQVCQAIEHTAGRERIERWGARTLDIDILFYGSDQIRLPQLTVPHPRMTERRFVLEPLAEVLPDWIHPENGRSVQQLLQACTDPGWVRRAG
ncbi:MAG: 2-amino-4-hydroxy-6-hydroxymethyldihydropteridine diphosphokinase [Sphingobacteriales bacterium]|nr:MAG: 2-amino-4-hydroxy-6-hydroxymethyldihydropteridine diphosphokinase [Sphingobacteriales bacterium]